MKILKMREEIAAIEQAISSLGEDLTILEAGCGRRWPLKLTVRYRLVGVDPDENALKIRLATRGDLDEYQVCKVNDAAFSEQSFDVIYCSYVLEHVRGVPVVLEAFARWIKPGGLVVLRIPDSRSVYGFLAHHTPHWFHVIAQRYVFRFKHAGKRGFGPYPVVYEPEMSLASLERYCARNGFSMTVTANAQYLETAAWLAPFAAVFAALSFGYLEWRHSDLAVLIRT